MLRLSLLSLFFTAVAVRAQADWTCSSTADCPAWYNASDHRISPNSTCVADPIAPQYGYCGFVGASCATEEDCDYGQCVDNMCYGYYGAPCSANNNCLGTLQCGTDGLCGGAGGSCPNGNTDCASNTCTNGVCQGIPQSKMAIGSGCQNGTICSTGYCDTAYTCARQASVVAPPASSASASGSASASTSTPVTASQNARHRARAQRDNLHKRFIKATTTKRRCAPNLTACMMGISSGSGLAFECIDTTSTLESCGGCMPVPGSNETQFSDPSAPAGIDCTALPNVEEVVCQSSRCKILACLPGSSLSPDGEACQLMI